MGRCIFRRTEEDRKLDKYWAPKETFGVSEALVSINDQGFLSPEIEGYRATFRGRHAAYFDFVERVSHFCHKMKFTIKPIARDAQVIFATGLFIKLMADVEGAVLLLERGLVSQAVSLLRIALEALITLAKVCQSYEFVEAFIRVGELQRLKLVKRMRDNPAPAFDAIRGELTDELIKHIDEIVGDIKEGKVEQWAKGVNLSPLYDGQYRCFSVEVHSRPRCLGRYLIMDEAGEWTAIEWGPNLGENLRPELIEAARTLTVALSFLDKLFEWHIAEQIDKFTTELAELDKQAGEAAKEA